MKMRWAWTFPVLSSLAVTLVASISSAQFHPGYAGGGGPPIDPAALAQAQAMYAAGAGMQSPGMMPPGYPQIAYPQSSYAPPGMMPMGVNPAMYMNGPGPVTAAPEMFPGPTGPMPGPMGAGPAGPMGGPPDAFGGYGEMPTNYGMGAPMDTGCPYCGGRGCEACRHMRGHHRGHGLMGVVHHGLFGDLLSYILPYGDGGCAAIRWYDVAIDGMYLKREDAGRNQPFASQGTGGPIVLQTDDLEFEYEPSFRFSGVFQAGPGSNVEFTYFGLFHYADQASVQSSADNLFSVVSGFGVAPLGGFPETDQSDFQQITYTSTFDSFEINFRQRWISANCRYQGSWLAGVRHFILDEKFQYFTSSSLTALDPTIPNQAQFDVDTTNNLTGAQFGGDLWICLLPGLRLGGEAKGGIYCNHINVNTNVGVNTGPPTFLEQIIDDEVAILGEVSLMMTYRINYQWTARAGYQFLYVDSVALAPENFNTTPPFAGATRTPFIDPDGDVFYHGYFAGMEFMW